MQNKFDATLRLLEREDSLTNSRMTWYLNIQGFIVAAGAVVLSQWVGLPGFKTFYVILLFAVLSILISTLVLVAAFRARRAKANLVKYWTGQVKSQSAEYPELQGDSSMLRHLSPSIWLPIIFILFWIVTTFMVKQHLSP